MSRILLTLGSTTIYYTCFSQIYIFTYKLVNHTNLNPDDTPYTLKKDQLTEYFLNYKGVTNARFDDASETMIIHADAYVKIPKNIDLFDKSSSG